MATLPRSGSTLVAQHIGEHSDIFHVGESMYWEMLTPQSETCSCGKKPCDFLQQIFEEMRDEHLALPLLKVWQILDKRYWPNRKTYVDSVVQEGDEVPDITTLEFWLSQSPGALDAITSVYSKYSNKHIFLDNTKLHHIAERLLYDRNNWGAIALTRDPRGMMSSFKNAGIRKGDLRNADSILPLCLDFAKFLLKEQRNNKMEIVRYEDFCTNPIQTLTNICNFIGVPFERNMLNSITSSTEARGHVLKGNHILKSNNVTHIQEDKSWQQNLTDAELNSFYSNEELLNLYIDLGYNFDI